MTELWIASANAKKRAELERLLAPHGFRVRSLAELDGPPPMVEDRDTFAGNAEVKAVALACAVGALAIGDDSGLCVDALGGAPGVYSARWAGDGAADGDLVGKLLAELDGIPAEQRGAHFTCHLCLAGPDGVIATFEEHCHGRIAEHARGSGGFGYDPAFVPAGHDRTFAELTPAEKDTLSHRGRALRRLARFLTDSRTDRDS